jgi:hypothetical protein
MLFAGISRAQADSFLHLHGLQAVGTVIDCDFGRLERKSIASDGREQLANPARRKALLASLRSEPATVAALEDEEEIEDRETVV